MMRKPGLIGICILAGLAGGMVAAAGVHAADSPGIWTHRAWLWDFAVSAALVYMLAPLAVLGALQGLGRSVSTGVCVGVTLGWYGLVFVAWMATAWMSEGAFPVWGWRHYGVDLLPIPLSMGLAFSVLARVMQRPAPRTR
jgi:hypothetical protein